MGERLEKSSSEVRKRIEGHAFSDEAGEEYEGSEFGGFGDYFRRKKIKLQNLDAEMRAAGGDKPQIFKGVVAHISGYTQPSLQVLHKELVQHGAGFLQYLDGKTMATHIIASSMPPKKALEFARYRVVKPAWVMDSIQAGQLLPWSNYRALDDGPKQKTIQFNGAQMFSQATQPSPRTYREQSDNSFYTKQFRKSGVDLNSQGSSSPFQQPSIKKPPFAVPGRTEAAEMNSRRSSSPFQPPSIKKPPLAVPSRTEAIDEMDSDTPLSPSVTLGAKRQLRDAVEDEREVVAERPIESPKRPIPERRDVDESPSKRKALTSEEHNANLLKDPKIWKSTTANPDFLKQFYSESRLHHLSTWKAQLKSRMQAMAAARGPVVKRVRRKGVRRYVMHVDFDSFFCAVSLKQAPEFRDKPAAVAHSAGGGSEIASCNYPARKFGVKNGMWMKKAMELCHDLKVLSYDFPAYEEASRLFYDAILDVGGIVQSVSIDEALVDITDIVLADTGSDGLDASEDFILRERERADEIALKLRDVIKSKTDCHVSVGMGANILLAKVALRKAKPAGQYQIKPDEVLDILGELPVESLPGVAYSIGGRLEEMGIKFVKDIRNTSKERLTTLLGPKTGEKLWEYSRGIDHAEVGEQPIRKSVSAEVNWGIRFVGQDEADAFLRNLAQELERRLLAEGVRGKHFTMKIMRRAHDAPLDPPKHLGHGKCDTFNKSKTFGVATHDHEIIAKEAISILRSYKFTPGDIRGIGLQMTKLEPLKTTTAGADGSQKKLNFGNFTTAAAPKKSIPEQIYDHDDAGPSEPVENAAEDDDPISFDPLTPRKPRVHPALALSKASAIDLKATTPLNMTGTQFIFPSHPDPSAVAALPPNILEQFQAQRERASKVSSRETSASASRSHSPSVAGDVDLPPGIDLKAYNEIPDEFKAEALAYYRQLNDAGPSRPPPSPRRDRPALHRPNPPAKRGIKTFLSKPRGGGRGGRGGRGGTGRIQTTLVAPPAAAAEPPADPDLIPPLSPTYLAALPEELRREVVAEHERQLARRRPRPAAAPAQSHLLFPPAPPKAGFGRKELETADEAKALFRAWLASTTQAGPHVDDVEKLGRYLGRVVKEERNMEKARQLQFRTSMSTSPSPPECPGQSDNTTDVPNKDIDKEPFVGGYADALTAVNASFRGKDGSLDTRNTWHYKVAQNHLFNTFRLSELWICEPWVVLGCYPTLPEGRMPTSVGGMIAIWRGADDMGFWPCLGEWGLQESHNDDEDDAKDEVDTGPSLLLGFEWNCIPDDKAILGLVENFFPDIAAVAYVNNCFIVELPRSDRATFVRRLQTMPRDIVCAPFTLQYHNGPLPNTPPRVPLGLDLDERDPAAGKDAPPFQMNDVFVTDTPTAGRQRLMFLGRRFQIEKSLQGVFIIATQGVYGTNDPAAVTNRARGAVLYRSPGSQMVEVDLDEYEDQEEDDAPEKGESCGKFRFAEHTAKDNYRASSYLLYAGAFDPDRDDEDGWTFVEDETQDPPTPEVVEEEKQDGPVLALRQRIGMARKNWKRGETPEL